VTASRSSTSTGGVVQFILNGGVSGAGNIAFGDLLTNSTQVFSGNTTIRTNGRAVDVSVLASNAGGPLQVLGGTISIQLLNRVDPYF